MTRFLDMTQHFEHDVLVIGSGAAGLTLALKLADSLRVALLCKDEASGGSTYYAQGGVAGVIDQTDTVAAHVDDAIAAGAVGVAGVQITFTGSARGQCHKTCLD